MFRLREQLRRLEVQYGPHWAKKRRYWQGCIACEVLWGVFAIWRLIKEKDKPTRGSTTRQAVWDGPWQGGMRWFRGLQQGAATQKGRGQRDSQWRGGLPVQVMSFSSMQKRLCQIASKGRAAEGGSQNDKALSCHWSADAEHSFMMYAKQAGFR